MTLAQQQKQNQSHSKIAQFDLSLTLSLSLSLSLFLNITFLLPEKKTVQHFISKFCSIDHSFYLRKYLCSVRAETFVFGFFLFMRPQIFQTSHTWRKNSANENERDYK